MKRYIISQLFLLLSVTLMGQDVQYSQFYATPLHINPGFTGSTVEHRLVMNYRNQWPSIPKAFQSYHASYEYNASEINSGFGLVFNREEAGSFGLRTNEVALAYAYHFRINQNLYLQPGLKFGYAFRGIDYDKLVFNDQLESGSSITADEDAFAREDISYPDISTGILLYGENYWAGIAINHLNRPDQTLLGDGRSVSELPMKYSVQLGYTFDLSGSVRSRFGDKSLQAVLHYKAQGKYDQLDMGGYYNHAPCMFGFWYRGIPRIKKYKKGYHNHDAIIAMVGYSIPDRNFNVGYSYDITISRLAAGTGGAHEISVTYEFASQRKKRKKRKFRVPCAKF